MKTIVAKKHFKYIFTHVSLIFTSKYRTQPSFCLKLQYERKELNGFPFSPEKRRMLRTRAAVLGRVHASYCSPCYLNLRARGWNGLICSSDYRCVTPLVQQAEEIGHRGFSFFFFYFYSSSSCRDSRQQKFDLTWQTEHKEYHVE